MHGRIVKFILGLMLVMSLSGCQSTPGNPGIFSWETLGITSTGSMNHHVEQAANNHKNDLLNQVKIAQITANVCSELKYTAKKNNDDEAWARAIVLETNAQSAAKEAGLLSEVVWDKTPEPTIGFMDIITTILQALGITSTGGLGIMAVIANRRKKEVEDKDSKLKRVVVKAKKYAKSTQVDDVEDDEDLA